MADLTIVFVPPCSRGHLNAHHAILRFLMRNQLPGVSRLNLHVASDEPARKVLSDLYAGNEHCSVHFHAIGETDQFDNFMDMSIIKKPSPSLTDLSTFTQAAKIIFPCPELYFVRYNNLRKLLEDIKPDLVVLDLVTRTVGVDACKAAGIDNFVLVSPGPSLDLASVRQPQGRGLWYYPGAFSNRPFPIPWLSIPRQVILVILSILWMATSPARKNLDAARNEAGISGSVLSEMNEGARAVIHASQPEIEIPHLPLRGTVFCGPIIENVSQITASEYSEITHFLDQGRTLLINLGTIYEYSSEELDAVASAVELARERLAKNGGFQLLWKVPKANKHASKLTSYFGTKHEDTLIKEWLEPQSLAILQHPNLVAHVHHGGANSLIEDAFAGVPQILLPMWFDLYTLAVRTEWLGHGIYANRGYEPSINGPLLADAIVRILNDEPGSEGVRIRQKAAELAKAVRATTGPKTAAETIIAAAQKKDEDIPFHKPALP